MPPTPQSKKLLLISSALFLAVLFYFSPFEPKKDGKISSEFGNGQIEKAITNYLLTQEPFSWKTKNESFNVCAIENLDSDKELFPLYIWVYCGEYIIENGEPKAVSGSSGPIKINYPNELSFYDLNKFTYEAPGDGTIYSENIKKIFPEDIQQKIFKFDRTNIIKKIEDTARAKILSAEISL